MKNIKIIIQYDGTRYKGWQKQKNSKDNTIEGKIESVLSKMTNEKIELVGCARTDSGSHAENYIANFCTKSEMYIEGMINYLREYLPEDIVIKDMKIEDERFHSRYNVLNKTYVYRIDNNTYMDVFNKRYSYHLSEELTIDNMNKASEYLIGTHDFKSFTNSKSKNDKITSKTINFIKINKQAGIVTIEINANDFLLNMVRIIVGTLIQVGLGKIHYDKVEKILKGLNRELAGDKVPSKGLILKEVNF